MHCLNFQGSMNVISAYGIFQKLLEWWGIWKEVELRLYPWIDFLMQFLCYFSLLSVWWMPNWAKLVLYKAFELIQFQLPWFYNHRPRRQTKVVVNENIFLAQVLFRNKNKIHEWGWMTYLLTSVLYHWFIVNGNIYQIWYNDWFKEIN